MKKYNIEISISRSNIKKKSQDTDIYILKNSSRDFYVEVTKEKSIKIPLNANFIMGDTSIPILDLFKEIVFKSNDRIVFRNTTALNKELRESNSLYSDNKKNIKLVAKVEDDQLKELYVNTDDNELLKEIVGNIAGMTSIRTINFEKYLSLDLDYDKQVIGRYTNVFRAFQEWLINFSEDSIKNFHKNIIVNKSSLENIKKAENLYNNILSNYSAEKEIITSILEKFEDSKFELHHLPIYEYIKFSDYISTTRAYEYFNFIYNKGSLSALNTLVKNYYYLDNEDTADQCEIARSIDNNDELIIEKNFGINYVELKMRTTFRICTISDVAILKNNTLYKAGNFLSFENFQAFNQSFERLDESLKNEVTTFFDNNPQYSLTLQYFKNKESNDNKFVIQTPSGDQKNSISFDLDNPIMGNRIVALIGQNGTGKTKNLENLYNIYNGIQQSDKLEAKECLMISEESHYIPHKIIWYKMHTQEMKSVRKDKLSGNEKVELLSSMKRTIPNLSNYLGLDENELDFETLEEKKWRLSTGQINIYEFFKKVLSNIESRSLILIDEIESGFHPELIQLLMLELNELLSNHNSFAIVATHSLHVLQCIPKGYIYNTNKGEVVGINTFGENLGLIEDEIFGLQIEDKFFLKQLIKRKNKDEVRNLNSRSLLVNSFEGDWNV